MKKSHISSESTKEYKDYAGLDFSEIAPFIRCFSSKYASFVEISRILVSDVIAMINCFESTDYGLSQERMFPSQPEFYISQIEKQRKYYQGALAKRFSYAVHLSETPEWCGFEIEKSDYLHAFITARQSGYWFSLQKYLLETTREDKCMFPHLNNKEILFELLDALSSVDLPVDEYEGYFILEDEDLLEENNDYFFGDDTFFNHFKFKSPHGFEPWKDPDTLADAYESFEKINDDIIGNDEGDKETGDYSSIKNETDRKDRSYMIWSVWDKLCENKTLNSLIGANKKARNRYNMERFYITTQMILEGLEWELLASAEYVIRALFYYSNH